MEGRETSGKRMGLIRNLWERNRSAASEEPEKDVHSSTPQEEAPAVEEVRDAGRIEVKGALLEAWKSYMPGEKPLELTLSGQEHGCAVALNERELGLERVRVSTKIERDAREYLSELNKLEEIKLRIEAKKALVAAGEGGEEAKKAAEEPLPTVKAKCCVYVSANGMTAWMMIFPPSDPALGVGMAEIASAMETQKITTGIDAAVLTYLIQQHPYFTLIPCACGTPAQEGEDGRVIEHFARQLNRTVKMDERGVADYRAMNYTQTIREGEVICDIIPPKPGTAGVRVDGTTAEPHPVKAAKAPAGKNTRLNEEGTQLLADKDGHLEFDGTNFIVKLMLDIPGDVDYSTGHIDYHGDVHIHGDVRGTFIVKAGGTVTIDGLVESATVEAGGDVLISCGVLGDNSAVIKSGGNIRTKYLENCVAYAGKSVFADCIISSRVYSDESVQVTSGRGTIIGGTIVAARAVKSRMIGTESGRKTEIELGTLTYIKAEHGVDTAQLKKDMDELKKLDMDIAFLTKRQKMTEGNENRKNPRLEAALTKKEKICAEIEELTARQLELEKMKPDPAKCRLEASTVYPPTALTIGDAFWRFDDVKHSCVAILDQETGEVKVS